MKCGSEKQNKELSDFHVKKRVDSGWTECDRHNLSYSDVQPKKTK